MLRSRVGFKALSRNAPLIRARTMRLILELAKRSFQRHMTYRAAALAGLMTNLVFGALRAAVLLALYGERSVVAGISTQDVVTYVALTQAVIAYLSIFGWYDLMNSVHTGEIAMDLLKPMNLYTFWLARDLGRAATAFLWRALPLVASYSLLFDMTHPSALGQVAALIVAIFLSWLVSFSWYFLVNLTAFWTPYAQGIGRFGFVIIWFLSGFMMPLRFYPDWLSRLASLTPFPHMLNTVIEIYLGVVQPGQVVPALLLQASWALGLFLLGQLLLRAGVRRLVVLGG